LIFSLRYGTSDTELTLAKATLEGERTRTAAPLEGLDGAQNYVVAMGDDNIALLFSKYSDDGPALYYLTLGFDGLPQGDPLLVQVSADSIVPGAIAATADGYMFSYVTGYQPSSLFVQTVDASGTLAERVPFADNENGLDDVHSLLVRGDEALLAWTDTGGTWNANDLDRTTILSRLDLGGNRIAQDVRVQSPVTNQERVEPKLSAHGDDVGLLWSEGSVIYICAGCMPDNQLQFVMLDGSTLSPASEVLTLTNPAVQGGLVAPEAVWQGDELSVVAAVGYHVNGEGAAATLTCSAQ
jgi:hypothetical protein